MNRDKNKKNSLLKRIIITFSIFSIFVCAIPSLKVSAAKEPPKLNSNGVALMDATTGQLLYSKNPDTHYYPASTTKILTALVVLENAKLDDKVTVGKKPPTVDGTAIGLKEGEVFTVEELLLGLLMESGNDCAEALAEHVSGSNEEFAKLMNKRAKKAGATNSNFKNPSGLPDPDHYTTPRDLALIMKDAIKNPDFIRIDRTYSLQISPSTIDGSRRWLNNHNYILDSKSNYYYKYSVASKKGYTTEAHFTNIISATKDGHTLITSCLDGEGINQVYGDVNKIFDYGFENFELKKLYCEGDEIGSFMVDDETKVPLLAGKDIYYCTNIADKNNLKASIDYSDPIGLEKETFNRGNVLTIAKVLVNGTEFTELDLVSGIDREFNSKKAIDNFYDENSTKIKVAITAVLLLIIFIFINKKKQIVRKRRKSRINRIINR
ncbi:D-alanyl-D-alanine carboxypeptidase family protein [Clostridium sp. HBUAS56017]|uniref:D-alanyl-D-alanine carboxypeptidase family protein n=1 Tax=Clostridium sp. HBUAS56017 TaxID=2571128 RepID=UPI0011786C41|nr:D-alanyl-D-alanine carboxypeptidase family protein [Clostridium sp. HBUAS56017]